MRWLSSLLLDGLYAVLKKEENEASIKLSDATHPVFKAHFPQNPILPGFVHIDIIEDVFDVNVQGIKKAKYRALVSPKEILIYKKENTKVKAFVDEEEVASFSFIIQNV